MTPHSFLNINPAIIATSLLLLTYVLIITERLNRSIIAMLAGGLMVLLGVMNQEEAIKGIDFNTIALLAGMMMLVSISRRSGMFEFLAIWSAKKGRAQPWAMILILSVTTAILSAFLDNVTTVLLIAPVTLTITRELEVPPYPFLFSEVMASNIGGTATLIGDPPNIIIGSAANLSFNDFLVNLAPVIVIVLIAQMIAIYLIWGRRLTATPEARARVMANNPRAMIVDAKLLVYSLFVIALVIAGFMMSRIIHIEAGTIAICGGALLMLLHNLEDHNARERQTVKVTETLSDIDWITLFFFVGLFVVVHGVDVTGVLQKLAGALMQATGGALVPTTFAVLWSSAILSAIIDNIPFVATMIPIIKAMQPAFGDAHALLPIWWALSLGACLGGNGSLIGASANLTVAGIAERNGVEFSFLTFTKHAFGLMLMSMAISSIYVYFRYLM